MADAENERVGEKLKQRVAELERTVKALLKAVQEIESDAGEPFMPQGEYYGIKFEE